MESRSIWTRGWRGVTLILVGIVMGANLIAPAVAHVGGTINHLWTAPGHIRAKVRAFGDARWLRKNMSRAAYSQTSSIPTITAGTSADILTGTFIAPAPCALLMAGTFDWDDD